MTAYCDNQPQPPDREERPDAATGLEEEGRRWPVWVAVALAVWTALVFLVRFASPVDCYDLWWHMAYGRWFLANGTLIPDHAAFTWTPVEGDRIYCAWVGQLLLYLVHRAGGLASLFVLRYLGMSVLLVCSCLYARRRGLLGRPLTWLVCMVALLMSVSAELLKPEMLSLVLLCGVVYTWLDLKSGAERAWRRCYVIPVLMLIWVNTHGAFVFGLALLGVLAVGEEINALFNPRCALPLRVRRHLFVALVLSGLSVLATPYGVRYPLELVRSMTAAAPPASEAFPAYSSVFSKWGRSLHYPDYLAVAAAILAALSVPFCARRGVDWALLLVNAVCCLLYMRFLRTTFLWAPVFSLTSLHLVSVGSGWLRRRAKTVAVLTACVAAAGSLLLGGRAIWEAVCRPSLASWLGFGVSYSFPVEEAEFIEANYPGRRLGHDYNAGGYLLWKLWPGTRTFMDTRYFPFMELYPDYRAQFRSGRAVGKFLQSHPCEVWCVSLELRETLAWFRRSQDWRLVYYGASSAVYVRKQIAPAGGAPGVGHGIEDVKNYQHARCALDFALNVGNLSLAERMVGNMEGRFRSARQRPGVAVMRALVDGVKAYRERRYEEAIRLLEQTSGSAPKVQAKCCHHLAAKHWGKQEDDKALALARTALALTPNDPIALHNAGMLEWRLSQSAGGDDAVPASPGARDAAAGDWTALLRKFVRRAAGSPEIPASTVRNARAALRGVLRGRPPLLVPPPPRGAEPPRAPKVPSAA